MSDKVGLGIVGAGSIGIRGALQHLCMDDVADKCYLAAVCDPAPGRAAAAAAKYGVRASYEAYEDLLADDNVDAITICSPIGLHFDQGMAAIAAGKHIHFNKTMTTTVDEATTLIDAAAKAGVKLVSSPGQVLQPLFRRVRKLVLDGAIGRLGWAMCGAGFGSYHEKEGVRQGDDPLSNINPAWYWRNPGGGPMYDMTVYGLHNLTTILGPAKRVTGFSGVAVKEREFRGEMFPCDADDNTLLVLDFGDQTFAYVYGALAGAPTGFAQVHLFGTGGTILGDKINGQPVDYPGRAQADEAGSPLILLPHVTAEHLKLGEAHVFEDTMQLVRWVREGIPSQAGAEQARHVIDIIESGYRAAATGQTQELSTTFEAVQPE